MELFNSGDTTAFFKAQAFMDSEQRIPVEMDGFLQLEPSFNLIPPQSSFSIKATLDLSKLRRDSNNRLFLASIGMLKTLQLS